MERHPKVFTPLFVAMTRAGETGGVLESSLDARRRPAREADASLRRQIKSAMVYPIVVMTFAFAVLIALVTFIVPVFVGVFKQFGGDLPTITKFTVGLSHVMTGLLVGAHRRRRRHRLDLPPLEGEPEQGRAPVGPLPPADPLQDRRHRPEGRAGPLVADAVARS